MEGTSQLRSLRNTPHSGMSPPSLLIQSSSFCFPPHDINKHLPHLSLLSSERKPETDLPLAPEEMVMMSAPLPLGPKTAIASPDHAMASWQGCINHASCHVIPMPAGGLPLINMADVHSRESISPGRRFLAMSISPNPTLWDIISS